MALATWACRLEFSPQIPRWQERTTSRKLFCDIHTYLAYKYPFSNNNNNNNYNNNNKQKSREFSHGLQTHEGTNIIPIELN